jgi:hypothetical protein
MLLDRIQECNNSEMNNRTHSSDLSTLNFIGKCNFVTAVPKCLNSATSARNILGIFYNIILKYKEISLKNCVFWDVTPCGSGQNRRFGGT